MEPSAIERELDDLETRIERLRALYEQYFMGIEKLEPQIPRKDVERKIQLLRKEQIRNTALRFKFQMLIQRYNTMQQYWARVTREIENGTYRRDVMRAAARFGAKEALTILGKKRAQKYAALAEAQAQQKTRHQGGAAEDEVELGADDLIDDEVEEAELEEAELEEVKPAPPPPVPAAPKPAGLGGLRWGAAPPQAAPPPKVAATIDSKSAARPAAAPAPADASAAKRRVAELAAAMRTPSAQAAPAAPAASGGAAGGFGALDLDLDDSAAPPPVKPVASPAPAVRAPVAAAAAPAGPAASPAEGAPRFGALNLDFEAPAGTVPQPAASPAPAARPAASPAAAPPRAAVPARAPVVAARPPAAAPADGSLPEQRIRQIYASYVETKRKANESTAGLTYEKLAETLRVQAQRLRTSHPTKTIDYEVVVKDGKTQLKPVLK